MTSSHTHHVGRQITKAEIADERFVYYADSMLRLLSNKVGASWYTYKGQLLPLASEEPSDGDANFFLTRANSSVGVAPTLLEVQSAYPSVTELFEGDNVSVKLSDGSAERWDIINGVFQLMTTDTGGGGAAIPSVSGWAAQAGTGVPDRDVELGTLQDTTRALKTLINDLRATGILVD